MIHKVGGVVPVDGRMFHPSQPNGGRLAAVNSGGSGRFDGCWRVPAAVDSGTVRWGSSLQLKSGSQHEFKQLDLSLKL